MKQFSLVLLYAVMLHYLYSISASSKLTEIGSSALCVITLGCAIVMLRELRKMK